MTDPRDPAVEAWSTYYAAARREMEFRFGIRRLPKDRYKEQWALGSTPQQAAKAIYSQMQARGEV